MNLTSAQDSKSSWDYSVISSNSHSGISRISKLAQKIKYHSKITTPATNVIFLGYLLGTVSFYQFKIVYPAQLFCFEEEISEI